METRRWLRGEMLKGRVGAMREGDWYPYVGIGCRVLRKRFENKEKAVRYGQRVQARYFMS